MIQTRELKQLEKCWLSPEGKIIVGIEGLKPCAWHLDVACHLITSILELKPDDDGSWGDTELEINNMLGFHHASTKGYYDPTKYLESLGWMRLHYNYGIRKWIRGSKNKGINGFYRENKAQKNVIEKWCKLNKIPYEMAFIYM